MTVHTFTNPAIQQKATALARTARRPARYMSKNRRIELVKNEIIKDELIRQGYLRIVQQQLPAIIAAHVEVAKRATPKSTQERKLLFDVVGLLDEKSSAQETAGSMLARLFAGVQKREPNKVIDPYEYE